MEYPFVKTYRVFWPMWGDYGAMIARLTGQSAAEYLIERAKEMSGMENMEGEKRISDASIDYANRDGEEGFVVTLVVTVSELRANPGLYDFIRGRIE